MTTGDVRMNASILQFLKTNGEGLDAEIAKALHMSVERVNADVSELLAAGEVICCKVTRYVDGKMIQGVSCRLAGKMPPPARGPKPGAKKDASSGRPE
jgi:hypothetical protein